MQVDEHPAALEHCRSRQYGGAQQVRNVIQRSRVGLFRGIHVHRVGAAIHLVEMVAGQLDGNQYVTRVNAVRRHPLRFDDVVTERCLYRLGNLTGGKSEYRLLEFRNELAQRNDSQIAPFDPANRVGRLALGNVGKIGAVENLLSQLLRPGQRGCGVGTVGHARCRDVARVRRRRPPELVGMLADIGAHLIVGERDLGIGHQCCGNQLQQPYRD